MEALKCLAGKLRMAGAAARIMAKSLKSQTWEILLEKFTITGTEEVSSTGHKIINEKN